MEWTSVNIRSLRERYGLSQVKLAELTGVTTNYVYLLEKGVKQPSKTLQLLLGYISRDLESAADDSHQERRPVGQNQTTRDNEEKG